MRIRTTVSVLCLTTLLTPLPALAGELMVQAKVVSVEAVHGPDTRREVCAPKPPSRRSLAVLLGWDLGLHCRQETVGTGSLEGYRVSYEWDNRIHSRMMSTEPGPTIALRIQLD